jgi:hypothetical protein
MPVSICNNIVGCPGNGRGFCLQRATSFPAEAGFNFCLQSPDHPHCSSVRQLAGYHAIWSSTTKSQSDSRHSCARRSIASMARDSTTLSIGAPSQRMSDANRLAPSALSDQVKSPDRKEFAPIQKLGKHVLVGKADPLFLDMLLPGHRSGRRQTRSPLAYSGGCGLLFG